MQLGVTSMGSKVRTGGASTVAAAFKKLPGLKKPPATGAGVLSSVVKAADERPGTSDRLHGLARGAGVGAAAGAALGGVSATNFMTKKPGAFARLFAGKPTWGGAVRRVGAGMIAGGAIGGGIGAMTARKKQANVLGPTVWGERTSPYAGGRTNPFCTGILKGANVLGPTLQGERSSPFAREGRTNPFAKTPVMAKEAAKHWIAGAIKHPGALHRQLGVPQGQKIPAGKLHAAAEHGGKMGQRARLAETLKGMHHKTAAWTEGGRKTHRALAYHQGQFADELKDIHHEHPWSSPAGDVARILARRHAYNSEQKGISNLKLLNPFGGMGRKGQEALERVNQERKKAADDRTFGRDGPVDGMAAAMEELLAGSVDPNRGFNFADQVRKKVAAALARN